MILPNDGDAGPDAPSFRRITVVRFRVGGRLGAMGRRTPPPAAPLPGQPWAPPKPAPRRSTVILPNDGDPGPDAPSFGRITVIRSRIAAGWAPGARG
jgi:uncharacterized protein (DUF736 family)